MTIRFYYISPVISMTNHQHHQGNFNLHSTWIYVSHLEVNLHPSEQIQNPTDLLDNRVISHRNYAVPHILARGRGPPR